MKISRNLRQHLQRLIGLSVSNNTATNKKTNYAITWKASTSIIDNTLPSSQRSAGPPADSEVPNYLLRGNLYTLFDFCFDHCASSVMERSSRVYVAKLIPGHCFFFKFSMIIFCFHKYTGDYVERILLMSERDTHSKFIGLRSKNMFFRNCGKIPKVAKCHKNTR